MCTIEDIPGIITGALSVVICCLTDMSTVSLLLISCCWRKWEDSLEMNTEIAVLTGYLSTRTTPLCQEYTAEVKWGRSPDKQQMPDRQPETISLCKVANTRNVECLQCLFQAEDADS